MNTVIQQLKRKKILLSDSAWGAMLPEKGLKRGETVLKNGIFLKRKM